MPLLAEYNVFGNTSFRNVTKFEQEEYYDLIFNLSSAFALLGSAIAGPIFDNLGPRVCASGGAVTAAIGLAASGYSVFHPRWNDMLFVAYPLASLGGNMCTYGAIGWTWAFGPDRMNLIVGVASATSAASDSIVTIGVFLDSTGAISFPYFLSSLSVVSVSTVLVFLTCVPARSDYIASMPVLDAGREGASVEDGLSEESVALLRPVSEADGSDGTTAISTSRTCAQEFEDSYHAFALYPLLNMHFLLFRWYNVCF